MNRERAKSSVSTGKSIRYRILIGSGGVIVSTIVAALLALLCFGHWFGWDLTWRSFGVDPLHPFFFDSHAITDHAECAIKGFNPYVLTPCANITPFNYPPIWLSLGHAGMDKSHAPWLAVLMAASALAVFVTLLKGRSISDGLLASLAIVSPSMMMAYERGNVDLLILALVGGAALVFAEDKPARMVGALVLTGLAVVLKLYPVFCIALAARISRRTLWFAIALAALTLIYCVLNFDYLVLIRKNTPTTWLLSYGFKVPFLGLDRLLTEAKLPVTNLPNSWIPIAVVSLTLLLATAFSAWAFTRRHSFCMVANNTAGTAFLFGAGIYCGSFLLGANFTYRLMFLLLCLPQLMDWRKDRDIDGSHTPAVAQSILIAILLALWLNGNSIFLFVPQLAEWALFFGMTTIVVFHFLHSADGFWGKNRTKGGRLA
jgi:Glycosyltransferase family 87